MTKQVHTQKAIQDLILPVLKEKGKRYKKVKQVLARPAKKGEKIETVTSDGKETTNTAKAGDFIIQNQTAAKESYIIGGEKFKDRYEFLSESTGEFKRYKAKGKVIALKMTRHYLKRFELPTTFYFIAPWKEEIVVKKNDYLVCPPDFSEIYRIAHQEFHETYKLDE